MGYQANKYIETPTVKIYREKSNTMVNLNGIPSQYGEWDSHCKSSMEKANMLAKEMGYPANMVRLPL